MMRKIHSRERKNGLDAIFITQMILIGILVLYVAVLLFRKGESDTPFAEMEQAVEGVLNNSDMKEADHKMFRRNYRLNANDYYRCKGKLYSFCDQGRCRKDRSGISKSFVEAKTFCRMGTKVLFRSF